MIGLIERIIVTEELTEFIIMLFNRKSRAM